MKIGNVIALFNIAFLTVFPVMLCNVHAEPGQRNVYQWDSFKKRDFDGDKRDEILLTGEERTGILKLESVGTDVNNSTARWKFTVPVAVPNVNFYTWDAMRENVGPTGDFDGDGKTEMFMFQSHNFSLIQLNGDCIAVKIFVHSGADIGPRLFSRLNDFFGPVGDFDGDKKDEILLITTFPSLELLKVVDSQFVYTASEGYYAKFSDKKIDFRYTSFGPVGDFDGDGADEVAAACEWGIVVLKVKDKVVVPIAAAPNGTRYNDLPLNVQADRIGPAGDFDGDGKDELVITGQSGIGVLKKNGDTFVPIVTAPDGTYLGDWRFSATENSFGPVGDFDGDRKDELSVISLRSLGILKLSGSTFVASVKVRSGDSLGVWRFCASDDRIGPAGDFDGDQKDELVISSDRGMAVLKPSAKSFVTLAVAANGTRYGTWPLFTYNIRYCQNSFLPCPDRVGSHPPAPLTVHDPNVLYGLYRSNLISRHMSLEGTVVLKAWKPWPYVPENPLNWNMETQHENVEKPGADLNPDSCLMRMKSMSKFRTTLPDFSWFGCSDDYLLSGAALAFFSMEALNLGTLSSIGYAQNIFKRLQFSRFPLNYDMFVNEKTLVSADELIGICFGLLYYHRMCVKYKFDLERAEIEKLVAPIDSCLSRHGYWVLPTFANLEDVPYFTAKMVSKKQWWARQCALPYAYPLRLMLREMGAGRTDIKWDPHDYELYTHGKFCEKPLFVDAADSVSFTAAMAASRDGTTALTARTTVMIAPMSEDRYATVLKTFDGTDTSSTGRVMHSGGSRQVFISCDSPFVFSTLCDILKKRVAEESVKWNTGNPSVASFRRLSSRMSLPAFTSSVASNVQKILTSSTIITEKRDFDRHYLLAALCAIVVLESNDRCTDAVGKLFETLVNKGYDKCLFDAIAEKCTSRSSGTSVNGGTKNGSTPDRSVASPMPSDDLLNGTQDKWGAQRKTVSDALDGDTGWIALLRSAFTDDTLARHAFSGTDAESTALRIMREYATGAGIDVRKMKDTGLTFLLYCVLMNRWGLSDTPLKVLPQFDVNPERIIENLIPALYFESRRINSHYKGL